MKKIRKENLKYILYPICISISMTLPILIAGLLGYRFNFSPSMPIGIWKMLEDFTLKGSAISICIPINTDIGKLVLERKILAKGICPGGVEPMLKQVIAIEGYNFDRRRDDSE